MKFLKLALAAVIAALCIGTASAQYQNIPPNAVGPLNAYGFVCNPTASVGYPGVGASGCTLGQTGGPVYTVGTGTGECATAPANILGGSTAGSFTCAGTAGASTLIVNLPTAAHGWVCNGSDTVTGAAVTSETVSTTSAKLIFTSTTNTDVIAFACTGY